LGEGKVTYFEVKNCSEILVFEAVGGCNRFLMLIWVYTGYFLSGRKNEKQNYWEATIPI
jgi:hypothetical protein